MGHGSNRSNTSLDVRAACALKAITSTNSCSRGTTTAARQQRLPNHNVPPRKSERMERQVVVALRVEQSDFLLNWVPMTLPAIRTSPTTTGINISFTT